MALFDETLNLSDILSKSTPHLSNLVQKSKDDSLDETGKLFLLKAIDKTTTNIKIFREGPDDLSTYLGFIENIDIYMSFLRSENKFFSHQSDMISSVIPELFCQIFEKKLDALEVKDIIVSGQADLKIDFQILPDLKSPLLFKSKRVDVCVYKNLNMTVHEEDLVIPIPIISIENKVNLDKNMMYGIINTSSSIKKMYPDSKFYVYTEFSDLQLNKHNFAYSDLDEVFTLRRQKRASYRRSKKANPIHPSLIVDLLESFEGLIKSTVVEDLSLEEKMRQFGKLINS
jgi:hypothetical protein